MVGRGACTDAERRAARALHDRLRASGEEAWVETRWIRPERNASLALHALLAVIGGLVSSQAAVVGAAIAGAATLSLAVEAAGWTAPLARLLVRRATQHVLTEPEAEGVRLIVVAGYDAPRAPSGLVGGARRLVRRLPGRPLAWAAGCCAVLALAGVLRTLVVDPGAWLGAVQVAAIVVLLAAVGAAADIAGSAWSPGAGSAAATAIALALLEELRRDPPRALAPALLLVGGRGAGPESLRAHLRAERARPRETVLLEIGPCGAGAPGWAARHSQLRAAAARAAAALGGGGPDAAARVRRPAGARRLPAIAVAAEPVDDPEAVDPASLDATLDLALGVVDALDSELSAARPRAAS